MNINWNKQWLNHKKKSPPPRFFSLGEREAFLLVFVFTRSYLCFSVDTVITIQDIIIGFDKPGIDIDNITSIQRLASNNSWVVTFDSKAVKDAALNKQSINIAGCSVLLGDCENKVSIVKI